MTCKGKGRSGRRRGAVVEEDDAVGEGFGGEKRN